MSYTYNFIAYDPQGNLLPSAVGSFYADTDSALVNPLSVTTQDGVTTTTPTSNRSGLVYFTHDTEVRGYWKSGANTLRVSAWEAADASAADAAAARVAAEAAAATATAPTETAVRSVITTDLADPVTDVAAAVTSVAASAASTALAPIAPTGGVRAVGKGELTANVKDYGAKGDGATDDTAALQAAHNSGAAEVFYPAGTYKISGSITVATRQRTRGHWATIQATTTAAIFKLPASGTRIRFQGLELIGTMPTTNIGTSQNSVGIDCLDTTVNTQVTHLTVEDCIFDKFEGSAIRLSFVQHFKIRNNVMTNYGYAGVGLLSVRWGLVEGNDLTGNGNLPSYAPNSYGVYVSASETAQVGTATNPKSMDVMVRGNFVTGQRWEGLDTHVGERISFVNNTIRDCVGIGISVVYNDPGTDQTGVHPANALLSPRNILIEGNTITYSITDESNAAMGAGIVCRGSVSTDMVNKERCTAIIRGNLVKGYGRRDLTATGGIQVGSGTGMIISGNTLVECRVNAVIISDCRDTVVDANTFIDTWQPGSTSTGVYITRSLEPAMELTVTNNRQVRGSLLIASLPAGSTINARAIQGTNDSTVTVTEANNVWADGATFATAQVRQQTLAGGRKRVNGTAAPTTGTWSVGDEIRNTAPAAGGTVGWVCVAAGTPGTWKTFGNIAA